MKRWTTIMACGLVSAAVLGCGARSSEDAESKALIEEAVATARAWLQEVDRGEYDAAWQQAAAYLRNAVTRDQWNQSIGAARPPLGEVVERTLQSAAHQRSLPGAPDGHYVVVQFKTRFENKKQAVETVTPMREADGIWRVSGYYIR